ncbi:hypothetical protein MPER_02680 [Moniliophthora perniciosa FA553]|nr:hypothetical protein MPER_02680 [Moniliophthora perniciosa FA553]
MQSMRNFPQNPLILTVSQLLNSILGSYKRHLEEDPDGGAEPLVTYIPSLYRYSDTP